ncbi:MAG TPA: ribosome biogenesis GTP-binding protein YihA/YsxC [Pseudogracilibacillus sp.]|nr:ribosome biogenesis GTP-binding protein YihA/YsxC [Pseudogracilibacillus sp.]
MKVNKAEIEISAVSQAQYPTSNLPEIALAGRSNVGKSSFINKMINRKSLVRTSAKPGKTQTLNFYSINDAFYFVDVPGYGYAKVSKKEREKWGQMMEEYFETRDVLKLVVLIVDSRHDPTKDDLQMAEYLDYLELPLLVIATKLDKVPRSKRHKQLKATKAQFARYENVTIIPFSAETGENKEIIWREIEKYL